MLLVSDDTFLDNKSSSVQNTIKPSYRETLLQSCEDESIKTEYIYFTFDCEDGTKKLDRLRACRTGAVFMRHKDSGLVRVAAQSCHLRHCVLCTKTRTLTIKTNVTNWLQSARYPKIITLTLKHSDLPLKEQIDKLYSSFRELRRLAIMKNTCVGGIWFFQVKKSKTDGKFHPHLHCLVAGNFIPQNKLRKAWYKITGDSHVVDVRLVHDVATAARHVSRYAAEPCSLNPLSYEECYEVARSLESRRLCGTWGICKKLRITSKPEVEKTGWYSVGSWSLVYQMKGVDKNADAILRAWKTGKPLETGIDMKFLFMTDKEIEAMTARGSPEIEAQSYFDWSRKT